MIYNYRRGVDRELKRNVIRGGSLLTPLVAVAFLLVALFSFSTNQGEGQSPTIPLKKPNQSENQSKLPKLSLTTPKTSKTSAGGGSAAKPAMSFRSLSSPTSPAPAAATLPGLGGGEITSGSGGTISSPGTGGGGTTSSGSGDSGKGPSGGTSTPTVACSNLLSIAQLCTVCTPPLTLQPGQKALLSSDGTCTTVN